MLGSLNAAAEISYLTLLPAVNTTASLNSAGLNVTTYEGTMALIISAGTGSGSTPVMSTYFKTGPDTNVLNATNVQVAVSGINVSTVNTNGTNQIIVASVLQRACDKYLFSVGAISGSGANVPISITLAAGPKYTA